MEETTGQASEMQVFMAIRIHLAWKAPGDD